MIGSLRGTVIEHDPEGEVLVEVAGVGYRVTVLPTTAVALRETGRDVFLHVHHHIREDHQALFGFLGREERACFDALLGAHGVGPSLALAILSVHGPVELARVLADDDLDALCLVPGVGKKTAARLLVELQSRLDIPALESARVATVTGSDASPSVRADVRLALGELGYGPDEVRLALAELDEIDDAAELLRRALQQLAVSA